MATVVPDGERTTTTARGATQATGATALVSGEAKVRPLRVDGPIEEEATATSASRA